MARSEAWCAARERRPCACGCGELIFEVDRWNRPRRFARGHHKRAGLVGVGKRRSLRLLMSLTEAREIAGTLSMTTKMPGASYGLDAFECQVGAVLAEMAGSTCADCYARRNFYGLPHVRESQRRRQESLTHPRWADAMVELITHHCLDEPWFRWHDSGDLVDVHHLERIVEVVERTHQVNHWLPTREYGIVGAFLKSGQTIPANLTVRLSAYFIDGQPNVDPWPELAGFVTSTVHSVAGAPVQVSDRRRDTVDCKAYQRADQGGGSCGSCRACWSPEVPNVSYPAH